MGPNYLNKLSKKKCKKEVKERSKCKNWSKKLKVYFYVKQIIDKVSQILQLQTKFWNAMVPCSRFGGSQIAITTGGLGGFV